MRGQFRGYRQEPGVAPDSQVETFAALRLEIDSWRWQGCHLHPGRKIASRDLHRGDSCAFVRRREFFRIAPAMPNYLRFRINPDMTIALGTTVMDEDDREVGEQVELLVEPAPWRRGDGCI